MNTASDIFAITLILGTAAIVLVPILCEMWPTDSDRLRRRFKKLDARHEKLKRDTEWVIREKAALQRKMFLTKKN